MKRKGNPTTICLFVQRGPQKDPKWKCNQTTISRVKGNRTTEGRLPILPVGEGRSVCSCVAAFLCFSRGGLEVVVLVDASEKTGLGEDLLKLSCHCDPGQIDFGIFLAGCENRLNGAHVWPTWSAKQKWKQRFDDTFLSLPKSLVTHLWALVFYWLPFSCRACVNDTSWSL